jgi:hypothetical protein
MTDRYFVDSCVAIVLGAGAGMILSVIGQKMLNHHYQNTCNNLSNHNLIYTKGFLGDTYYCIKNSYLK